VVRQVLKHPAGQPKRGIVGFRVHHLGWVVGGITVGTIMGYARVPQAAVEGGAHESTLRAGGAERVFLDHSDSSFPADRPQWAACLASIRSGDTLVVSRLIHLGSSLRMVIDILDDLGRRGVNIRSLTEQAIDTTTRRGSGLFDIVGVFATLRADTLSTNIVRGLQSARAEGRVGGRPSVVTPELLERARLMRGEGRSIAHTARALGVGASSISRALLRPDPAQAENPTEHRVFFRDIKPYEMPDSLEELRGPSAGLLELPHSVYWGPLRSVSLDNPSGIRKAYQAVVREGTAKDQALLLNCDVLRREWSELALPDRVRVMWEQRFPELALVVAP